jgi:hypothetical protein
MRGLVLALFLCLACADTDRHGVAEIAGVAPAVSRVAPAAYRSVDEFADAFEGGRRGFSAGASSRNVPMMVRVLSDHQAEKKEDSTQINQPPATTTPHHDLYRSQRNARTTQNIHHEHIVTQCGSAWTRWRMVLTAHWCSMMSATTASALGKSGASGSCFAWFLVLVNVLYHCPETSLRRTALIPATMFGPTTKRCTDQSLVFLFESTPASSASITLLLGTTVSSPRNSWFVSCL